MLADMLVISSALSVFVFLFLGLFISEIQRSKKYLGESFLFLKLRWEDRRHVYEVIKHLQACNLKTELRGSVLKGDRKYKDIDLLATGSYNDVKECQEGMEYRDYRDPPGTHSHLHYEFLEKLMYFPMRSLDGTPFTLNKTRSGGSYVRSPIDCSWDIFAGKTTIDLSFQGNVRVGFVRSVNV